MGPQRGRPAAFHNLSVLTDASFKHFNSSSHQNLKKFLAQCGTYKQAHETPFINSL